MIADYYFIPRFHVVFMFEGTFSFFVLTFEFYIYWILYPYLVILKPENESQSYFDVGIRKKNIVMLSFR